MALDPALADQLTAIGLSSHQQGMALIGTIDRNAVQGLTVINSTLIQQHGGVADDAAQFAGMNTAAGIPQSGYVKGV